MFHNIKIMDIYDMTFTQMQQMCLLQQIYYAKCNNFVLFIIFFFTLFY